MRTKIIQKNNPKNKLKIGYFGHSLKETSLKLPIFFNFR